MSCAPAPKPAPAPAPEQVPVRGEILRAPSLTRVEGFADHLEITWRTFRREHDIVRGYDVYVSNLAGLSQLPDGDSNLRISLYGGASFPGDTDGIVDSESIRIAPVEMGRRYYVHVRTVSADGHQGPASEERDVIARPRGTLTIHPRFSSTDDGFAFASDRNVPCMSDSNDMYLFVVTDELYLGSPSRLNSALRGTRFTPLGASASIDDYPTCQEPSGGSDKIAIQYGESILVVTMEGTKAKLRPRETLGGGDSIAVIFDYIFQPIPGELRF